jgi:hypothetical protein
MNYELRMERRSPERYLNEISIANGASLALRDKNNGLVHVLAFSAPAPVRRGRAFLSILIGFTLCKYYEEMMLPQSTQKY